VINIDRSMINLVSLGMPKNKINSDARREPCADLDQHQGPGVDLGTVDLDVSRETIMVSMINSRENSIMNKINNADDHGVLDQEDTMINSTKINVRVGLSKITLDELMIIDDQVRATRVRAAFADSIMFDDEAL
jgi:hypothetical protein